MDRFRQQASQMPAQIDATLGSLNEVSAKAGADPRPSYDAYAGHVGTTESMAQSLLSEAESVRARGEAYFAEWEKEAGTIQNPEIRKRSEERRARLHESYKKIDSANTAARESLTPFLADLKDIRTLLANDLTAAGIQDARGIITKVNSQGAKVKEHLKTLCGEVEQVASQLRMGSN